MNHETQVQTPAISPTPEAAPPDAEKVERETSSVTEVSSAGRPRRRRGGRGRGRGRGGSAAKPTDVSTEIDDPARSDIAVTAEAVGNSTTERRRPRTRQKPKSSTPSKGIVEASDEKAVEPKDGAKQGEAGPATAARRRRRRGGRGRSRGKTAAPSTAISDTAEELSDASLALPDAARTPTEQPEPGTEIAGSDVPAPSRRRRGGRGRGKSGGATPDAIAEAAPETGPKTRRAAKPKTAEEIVASGGPTRGVRTTRTRTGQTGRRRREPMPVPPRVTDKLMVITEHGERDQIAVLEGRELVQHYVTRIGATSMVGNVYLGRVQNVLPGMEAAFVDIGRGRNGVLYAGEVNYSPEDLDGAPARIEHVLKSGQAVMVQVTKDPIGGKGARLTAQISMPGRFLVMVPNTDVSGISRRLGDDERRRLKAIMKELKPAEHGIIVRTAAEGASEQALAADLRRLVDEWNEIQKKAKRAKAPTVLYEEPELTVRVVRDLFTDEEFRELVTDSPRVYERVMEYVNAVAPDLGPKVHLHQSKLSAFEEFHVVEQIHKALDRKVWLPSGGYLIIERTEAMTIIDVNTGKSVGKTNLEETVVNTNLEAAREAARQLRLRDIGGIIVLDFIDMLLEQNKKKVEDTMKEALAVDKTRSQVFEIGPLGLMQVTRKRVSSGLVESFSETCPTCEGRGIVLNYEA